MKHRKAPLTFQAPEIHGHPEPRPVSKVIVDDLEISGDKIMADGFNVDSDGYVALVLKADDHVTLQYADEDGPGELRINLTKVDGR